MPVWTGVDFGAGPGIIAVREERAKGRGIVIGVGGGKKGGIVICSVELGRKDVTGASANVR